MLLKETIVNILDNSNAVLGKCIGFSKNLKVASVGDFVLVSLKKVKFNQKEIKLLKKGKLVKAVVIQTKKSVKRFSNFHFNFSLNGCVLLDTDKKPLGTKIKGLVPKELRKQSSLRVGAVAIGLI